jgi:hypothetical protein
MRSPEKPEPVLCSCLLVGIAEIARAFSIPKTVFGTTIVFRSLRVKSQTEYAWKYHELDEEG